MTKKELVDIINNHLIKINTIISIIDKHIDILETTIEKAKGYGLKAESDVVQSKLKYAHLKN